VSEMIEITARSAHHRDLRKCFNYTTDLLKKNERKEKKGKKISLWLKVIDFSSAFSQCIRIHQIIHCQSIIHH